MKRIFGVKKLLERYIDESLLRCYGHVEHEVDDKVGQEDI